MQHVSGSSSLEAGHAHIMPSAAAAAAAVLGHMHTRPTAYVRNYAVFLNHRGPDVKKSFVDHLLASLETAGVHSFVDWKDLKEGEDTWDAIESAIRHSKIHIAIFSPGYAQSSWCLRELHEILECRADGSSDLFLPVFYNVTPSDLRHSSSSNSCYSSAFTKLLCRNNVPEVVQNWRSALYQASMVNGWTLDGAAQGFEARFVKLIVSEVLNVLNRTLLDIAKHPVGVNEKLQKALDLIEIDKVRKGVHILGIFGMGGVGKTTLAKSIYNGIYREFECCCFMQSVRSEAKTPNGLRGVQERMLRALLKTEAISIISTSHGKQIMKDRLSDLKVLIILDDVDDREQLEDLLTPIESCRLRDGSQIVITTRDKQIVTWAKAQHSLLMEGLSEPHAHLLFSWHAFLRREEPSEDFKTLAKKVVAACQGLPLALEILGSHLYNKDIAFWRGTVKVLEGDRRTLAPAQRQVTLILKISFDGLGSEEERSMFLDIACFLLGEHEARATRIWRESDAAELCFDTLKLKCLVKIDQDRRLTMHDLLRDMGREIVEGSHKNIWKRSHLWNEDDVRFVLRNKKGTSEVRGVCLALKYQEEWDTRSFAGMDVLQLLVLSHGNIIGDFNFLSKELRWFQWRYCPLESLPCELALNNVVVLDLKGSKISSLSSGHMFESLRELNLSFCPNLKEVPEFKDCCNILEALDLGNCVSLESLPESIGCLSSSLTHLNLSGCSNITTLPNGLSYLHSLRSLLLNKCSSLTRLPDAIGQLTALEDIGLEWLLSLMLLPRSFGNLTNLSSLHLSSCSSLKELPSTIGNLRKLTSFTIFNCPLILEIPQGASSLTNLVKFEVSYCKSMSRLPDNIGNLHKLVTLMLHNNPKLTYVPSSIVQIQELVTLDLHGNCFSRLPEHFHLLSKLETLELRYCKNLREISRLPPSLRELDITGCKHLINLPQSASLTSLRILHLGGSGVSLLQDGPWIQKLVSLELVTLYGDAVPECFSNCKREIQVVRSKKNGEHCCMEVSVPEGDMACKGVVCCIVSHDQDPYLWDADSLEESDFSWDYGSSYKHVHTEVMGAEGNVPKFSQSLFINRHRNQLHISISRATHPFTASLKGGDTIRIVEGQGVTVTEGSVKLLYEENEMEDILQKMSRQGGAIKLLYERDEIEKMFSRQEGAVNLLYEKNEIKKILNNLSRQIYGSQKFINPQVPIMLELTNWIGNGGLPDAYSTLSSLQKMDLQLMPISRLPSNFHLLTNLKSLELRHCHNLYEISTLPPTLEDIDLGDSSELRSILCLSSLKELRDLVLCNCIRLVELVGLDCLVHLSQLNITWCKSLLSLPSGLEKLTSLKFLYMAGSGVSLLQDNEPWIQKLASLELISVYGEEVPECLLKVKNVWVTERNDASIHYTVPKVDATYKAAVYCFVSCDLHCSNDTRENGRYRHSKTGGMDVAIIEEKGARPKFSQVLFGNRHGDQRNQLHISIFRACHPFVTSLKGGNHICMFSKAAMFVTGAGAVMSGENEMDETLRAMSRQLEVDLQLEATFFQLQLEL